MRTLLKTWFFSFLGFVFFLGGPAQAMTLKNSDGTVVHLSAAPGFGDDDKNAYLAKIEGIESVWADKVFLVYKNSAVNGERYYFDYTVQLSSGPKTQTYNFLVENGQTLHQGSLVETYRLYLPDHRDEEISLRVSENEADKEAMTASYREAPFEPKP